MRLRILVFLILTCLFKQAAFAQSAQPTWIWYPGDFDIWLGNQVQNLRTERHAFVPPFWRVYQHNPQVNFGKSFTLTEPEEISVVAEGKYNVTIDGKYVQGNVSKIALPKGSHNINFQVFNDKTPPAIFVKGKSLQSDNTWTVELVHNNSPDNIPGSATPVFAGSYDFNSPEAKPSQYKLATTEKKAAKVERGKNSLLVDFGVETFGYLKLLGLKGRGKVSCYYGESKEEALSLEHCETFDHYNMDHENSADFTSDHSRAFRFVNIQYDDAIQIGDVAMLYEYLPLTRRGAFRCSDDQINKIWDVAAYTLELNSREFFLDGIKRDRWVWSGDAVQSYLMNYYLFFNNDAVKRTTWAVRGGEPVEAHLNTILDYSLYWFTGIYEYYQYSGDEAFLKSIYPRMVSLMDFVLKRRNNNGMLEGLPGDWVFLDWAPMTKEGELSAIQLLLARSLETMGVCASLMGDEANATEYNRLAEDLKANIVKTFWDPEQQALVHSRKDGQLNKQVTRYANMFAMMFGYLDPTQVESVKDKVLLNNQVQMITTPYMRFYELEALAAIGQQNYVTGEMKNYWGGMLDEGATSFWEAYDPNEKGAARYAMYGRPFGKSLCHAWGASPIYLLGKYYLGVKPLQQGYSEYLVEPNLGGLKWMEGKVPTPQGDIAVSVTTTQIKVKTAGGKGTLRFRSQKKPSSKHGKISRVSGNIFEMNLDGGKEYVIRYLQ